MLWIIIIAAIVGLDQWTKYLVTKNVTVDNPIVVIKGFFYITHTTNRGAAWGILQNGRLLFLILTVIIAAVIVYYMLRIDNRLLRTSLSFILGGAAGNFIDRAVRGSVVDFLDFYFGTYNYPTFNVADSFIVMGTILLAYYMFFKYEDRPKTGE